MLTTSGAFVDVATARARPLETAAANWVATATLVARHVPDALLVDVGSTTADVVPIRGGGVAARGRTDPERLLARELVYTGAVRTNVAAVVPHVPLWGGQCPVASEWFALSGDAHVLASGRRFPGRLARFDPCTRVDGSGWTARIRRRPHYSAREGKGVGVRSTSDRRSGI